MRIKGTGKEQERIELKVIHLRQSVEEIPLKLGILILLLFIIVIINKVWEV